MKEEEKWPYQWTMKRIEARKVYLYGKYSCEYTDHVMACEQCDLDGLCQIGTALNQKCLILEEKLFSKED